MLDLNYIPDADSEVTGKAIRARQKGPIMRSTIFLNAGRKGSSS